MFEDTPSRREEFCGQEDDKCEECWATNKASTKNRDVLIYTEKRADTYHTSV